MEGGAKGFGQFVVAGGYPAELFELVEITLHPIAFPVEGLVVRDFLTPRTEGRNDRFDSIEGQPFADPIRIVASIQGDRLQDILLLQALVEAFKLAAIMGLACRQVEGDAAIFVDRGRVDFGAPASTRAAQSLLRTVFFGAPAACGWARTVVESMNKARASAKRSRCKFCHKRTHTPRASQRRKRM